VSSRCEHRLACRFGGAGFDVSVDRAEEGCGRRAMFRAFAAMWLRELGFAARRAFGVPSLGLPTFGVRWR
jgi:hypothetical protein